MKFQKKYDDEFVAELAGLLRENLTLSDCARRLGVSYHIVYGLVRNRPELAEPYRWWRLQRAKGLTEKKRAGPKQPRPPPKPKPEPERTTPSEDEVMDALGMTAFEASRRNMRDFFSSEIDEYENGGSVDEVARRVLRKYALVEVPSWYERRYGMGRGSEKR